ncbi:MAG: 30S ribosomal protein S13 [Candidatus Buchananbacteria bacterium]
MARIAGVTLPANKRIEAALPYIYGIGPAMTVKILAAAKVSPDTRTKDLKEDEVNRLQEIVKTYKTEGDLRRDIMSNIKRLKEINSYRGLRHAKSLPARGQRTKTNSRTVRHNMRRTMGSGRKADGQKT